VRYQDPVLVGRIATASSRINQRFLPKPQFEQLQSIAECRGALGVQVAHSGTVAGLLFDPSDPHTNAAAARAWDDMVGLGLSRTYRFRTAPA
jgi:uncharacterized protein involved in propanediol utilization